MIDRMFAAAALAALPVTAAEAAQPPAPPAAAQPAVPAAGPIEPARLAAAERLLAAMWPDELFTRAIEGALAQELPGWPPPPVPGDAFAAERARLTRAAAVAELTRLARSYAPEMRTLTARHYARRLSVAEIDEAARFYASPAGRRFVAGAMESTRHVEALRGFRPEPDPELIAGFMRVAMRIDAETRHLAPPPPAQAPVAEAEPGESDLPVDEDEVEAEEDEHEAHEPPSPPTPPPPPPPPPPPADPARLAAARSATAAIFPDEAFSQPLPLPAVAETLMALPISSFGLVAAPPGFSPAMSIGQVADRQVPNFQERTRIASRILAEELPALLPRAAPVFRAALSELYARTFTVAELEAVGSFYRTAAGRALARESFASLANPELARGLVLMAPRAAADAVGAVIRIGQATAHLPPPPAAPAPPEPEGDETDGEHDDHE